MGIYRNVPGAGLPKISGCQCQGPQFKVYGSRVCGFRVYGIKGLRMQGLRGSDLGFQGLRFREPGPLKRSYNVGPLLLNRSPIVSFGACLFRIMAMIARPPITCFDFGALII